MLTLENSWLKATFNEKGGELTRLYHKKNQLDYLHDGNPDYWNRHAPVLFPIVGRLKDNHYFYEEKEYILGQHGFARDEVFEVVKQTKDEISFQLKSSPKSKTVYPFDFILTLTYVLKEDQLTCYYRVENPAKETLYFSIGGHPAFKLPLTDDLQFSDYTLKIKGKTPLEQLGLTGPFLDLSKTITTKETSYPLNYELFKNDALIFKTLGEYTFSIASEKSAYGLDFSYDSFDFVGFWTPYGKDAPFLCIEPWCGIADTTQATGELKDKFGIHQLKEKETFSRSFTIHCY